MCALDGICCLLQQYHDAFRHSFVGIYRSRKKYSTMQTETHSAYSSGRRRKDCSNSTKQKTAEQHSQQSRIATSIVSNCPGPDVATFSSPLLTKKITESTFLLFLAVKA